MKMTKRFTALILSILFIGFIISVNVNAAVISKNPEYTYYENNKKKTETIEYTENNKKIKTEITSYNEKGQVIKKEVINYSNLKPKTHTIDYMNGSKKTKTEISRYNEKGVKIKYELTNYYTNQKVKNKKNNYLNNNKVTKTEMNYYNSNSQKTKFEVTNYINGKVNTKKVDILKNNKKIRTDKTTYNKNSQRINLERVTYSNNKTLIKSNYKIKNNKLTPDKIVYFYNTHKSKKKQLKKAYKTNFYNKKGKLSKVVFHTNEGQRNEVVAFAKKQKGKAYSAGSAGPKSFDCSGLTSYIYKKSVNKKIGRSTFIQVKKAKKTVSINTKKLKKGDLLFWGSKSAPYHVGIYLGNGNYLHAGSPATGVKVGKVNGYFKPSYAKRVI